MINLIEELKATYAAATPGEWNNTEQSNGLNSVYGNCQYESMADADLIAFDIQNGDDAEFIVLAHNAMPMLLEAVEVLKEAQSLILGMGHIVRYLDNDSAYLEAWTNDGEYLLDERFNRVFSALAKLEGN